MKAFTVLVAAALFQLTAAGAARADVRVSMKGGLVTIAAKDVTVRQILTEWSKVGQTTFINVDRIPGGPVTIELTDVPEKQALDIVLRDRKSTRLNSSHRT